ncbi:MAG: NADH:ubiquinone oxidoreductase [Paracoccaceae bacterium]|nr:MAG: NADH:ubiquinone oxidoreductase [Paracoccaceae bacterium]
MKNAPQLWGWLVAAGAAATGFGAAVGPVGLSSAGAVMVAAVLFVTVGLILGMPAREEGDDEAAAAEAERPLTPSMMVAQMSPAETAWVETRTAEWTATPAPEAEVPAPARPQGLSAARGGQADDLKLIKGIGPKLELLCHSLGYYHFDQIAAWTPAEIAWVDDNLEGFKGRVTRDDWVAQARVLAAGGQPA